MGLLENVKRIVEKFKKKGKSDKEITDIIKTAADIATVPTGQWINKEIVRQDIQDLNKVSKQESKRTKEEINNWRKLHGMCMVRKKNI